MSKIIKMSKKFKKIMEAILLERVFYTRIYHQKNLNLMVYHTIRTVYRIVEHTNKVFQLHLA
jgi:hypothetical protein